MPSSLPIRVFMPGKVILFGEHAVVYGYPGLAAALSIGLDLELAADPEGPRFTEPEILQPVFPDDTRPEARRLAQAFQSALVEFGLENAPIAVRVQARLPFGIGMGSSAAFSAAAARALGIYSGLTDAALESRTMEVATVMERVFHGNPSGLDLTTILSGRMLWFRRGTPPEKLIISPPYPIPAVIAVVEPGGRTIELVQGVRSRYDADSVHYGAILEDIAHITLDGRAAVESGDLASLGTLMSRNQELLRELGVSTPALDRACRVAMEEGALGAKLTGSGGGGAIIVIPRPGEEDNMVRAMRKATHAAYRVSLGGVTT